ncbi:glycosyltransferase family 4 protein [Lichenicola sp.]|uniref:glycosyltransferase family 4 protein n=1 Tax=Lichenicola sp. TaxID=2804529 RepID=UPI003B005B4E
MSRPSGRPSILLIANNFPPVRGGSAIVYDNLARQAPSEILVLAPRRNYLDGLPMIGWREHDRRAPYATRRLDLLRTLIDAAGAQNRMRFLLGDVAIRLRLLWTVLRLVRGPGVQAVCVGELLSSGWLLTALRRLVRLGLRLRLVVYVHGEEITTQDPYDPDRRRCRRALLAADRIVVVSRFTLETVRALLGPDSAGRLRLIENGVDTGRFFPGARRPDLVRRYRLSGCFSFVSVCRLLEKKGLDQAIRAFATLAPSMPELRYLIVGGGPFEPELRRIIGEMQLEERVILAGQVTDEELVAHYRLGDVFVMPNRELENGDTEGFGLVFLEANACGLPVIAGCDGGSRDAVRSGENGLVVDGRSVTEIAAAMRRLVEDGAAREALAASGLRVAAGSGWESKSRQFLEVCGVDPEVASMHDREVARVHDREVAGVHDREVAGVHDREAGRERAYARPVDSRCTSRTADSSSTPSR